MFFIKASKESAVALKAILARYEEALGQLINREKLSIPFSRKAPAELKRLIRAELQIQKEGKWEVPRSAGTIWKKKERHILLYTGSYHAKSQGLVQ